MIMMTDWYEKSMRALQLAGKGARLHPFRSQAAGVLR
jgi:hypothetical protein